MKKVLVIGAAGQVGMHLLKYLLAEGKYDITALDLKNRRVNNKLKIYRKRINIIYGDILDKPLIEKLVKNNDYVINLATCLPPLSEYKKSLVSLIEQSGTENIVRAISYYNPSCHLIEASTTSLYNDKPSSVKSKIEINEFDYYNVAKYNAEKFITKKLKNYTILRLPLILGDLRHDHFIYGIKLNSELEVITKEDAAYALAKVMDQIDSLKKKTINLGGGEYSRTTYAELLKKIMKYHGISFNYINTTIFTAKNYTSPYLNDSDESNKIIKYRNDTLETYFLRQKRRSKNRKFSKLLGKIIILIINKKTNKK